MCLVLFAVNPLPDIALIVAANRDEFHQRPTQAAHWWADNPDLFGGRDLLAGGTWLGMHRSGRFATVTNFRDAQVKSGKLPSRGALVSDFLTSSLSSIEYLQAIVGSAYAGFNLLVFDGDTVAHCSNQGNDPAILTHGTYGVSNAELDAPWHKVVHGKAGLETLLEQNNANETQLLRLLDDRQKGPATQVDTRRLPFPVAHAMTAPFIVQSDYGTRCSSVVTIGKDRSWRLVERRFDGDGRAVGDSRAAASLR